MKHYIRKYILVSAFVALGAGNAMAQQNYTTKTETKTVTYIDSTDVHYYKRYHQGFWDNWSIGIMGGARVLFAEEDSKMSFGKRLAPGFKFDLTKDISPDLSLRGIFGFGTMKGWNTGAAGLYKHQASWSDVDPVRTYLEGEGVDCSNGYEQEIMHYTIGADLMVNLWNVWTSNNQLVRKWNPYFFLGAEYFQILKHKGYERTYKVGLHAGLKCDWYITKRLALTGEISESTHSATFDNEIGKGNRHDFYVEAMLGLKIRLGKSSYEVQSVLPSEDYAKLEGVATNIKEKYEIPGDVQVMPSELLAPSIVFDDDKISYSQELQNVNLSQMAEWLQQNPSLKVSVIGNNHIVSNELAKARAEVVRQKLIDKYGIDGNRLIVTALDVNAEYKVTGFDQSVNFGTVK